MARKLPGYHYKHLRLLKLSPFERRTRGGWRFGTRRISDGVADRLIASGRAEVVRDRLQLKREDRP
ncbi:hypothetical protein [Bradyrhizobium sp. Bra78]|uniref:hypothetical protein n=1 Tax=Bradyrhizobium sp. Bra78 TaxID=2926010 RepID=UPI0021C65E1C|nr:hypothetical protein [Bradyrhizobium sp. Bra78]